VVCVVHEEDRRSIGNARAGRDRDDVERVDVKYDPVVEKDQRCELVASADHGWSRKDVHPTRRCFGQVAGDG
jgi:hypothetical protein